MSLEELAAEPEFEFASGGGSEVENLLRDEALRAMFHRSLLSLPFVILPLPLLQLAAKPPGVLHS